MENVTTSVQKAIVQPTHSTKADVSTRHIAVPGSSTGMVVCTCQKHHWLWQFEARMKLIPNETTLLISEQWLLIYLLLLMLQKSQGQPPLGRCEKKHVNNIGYFVPINSMNHCKKRRAFINSLGGGNSNIFYFHPDPWGFMIQFVFRTYSSKGLVGSTTNQINSWKPRHDADGFLISRWRIRQFPPPLAAGNRPVHISTLLPYPWRPCKETAGNVTTLLVGGPNTSRCRPWVTCLSFGEPKKTHRNFRWRSFFWRA